jgi:DNA-binding response OmpR family regulator
MAQILVAEPDRRIRDFVAGILSDCGHAVVPCADDREAAASLAVGIVDLVITDLVLSPEGGAALGKSCAALGVPVVTLSGREFRLGRPAPHPLSRLVDKPFRFADLHGVLDAARVGSRSIHNLAVSRAAA